MPPKFFSYEFHIRFFPALLWQRLRAKEQGGPGFGQQMALPLAFVGCCALVFIGLPMAIDNGSPSGWVLSGLGGLGLLALAALSIASRSATPDYENFLPGFFFFFVMLGLTSGIFAGALEHSLPLGMALAAVGLAAGYILGIPAGLWGQYLGRMAVLVNGLAWLAVVGMLSVDLVLLGGGIL